MQESGEMYLESILVLSKTNPSVRSIDVAGYLGYTKPSVSRAISLLKSDGHVKTDENGCLLLTDSGISIAEKIYERHTVLTKFLMNMGVREKTAADDACRMEHIISDETFKAIKNSFK